MKNSLFFGLAVFCSTLLMGQTANSSAQNSQKAGSVDLPYSYGFETADLDEWTITNEGSGNIWTRAQGTNSTPPASEGSYYMIYSFNSTAAANTYLYSRGLNLKAGKNLVLKFDYQGVNQAFTEKMEVKIGTAATVAGQTQQLFINQNIYNYPYKTETVNFTVPADGIYYISFRAFSDKDEFYLSLDNVRIYDSALGTENVRTSALKFYPNPVKDILTITDTKEIEGVDIYDISGKKVFSNLSKGSKLELNLAQLSAGTYIVKTTGEGESKTFKFIKK